MCLSFLLAFPEAKLCIFCIYESTIAWHTSNYPFAHAKVCNLDVALRSQEDIIKLQVSVDDLLAQKWAFDKIFEEKLHFVEPGCEGIEGQGQSQQYRTELLALQNVCTKITNYQQAPGMVLMGREFTKLGNK